MVSAIDQNASSPTVRKRIALCVVAFVAIASLLLMALRCLPQSAVIVHMRIVADAPGTAQWYLDRGAGYSEPESVRAPLRTGANDVKFYLPTGRYRGLRFDPINNSAHVKISQVDWIAGDAELTAQLTAAHLEPLANVDRITVQSDGLDVWPTPASDDPQLQLSPAPPADMTRSLRPFAADLCGALEAALAIVALVWLVRRYLPMRSLVCIGMALAGGLMLAMLVISTTKGSVHPDEYSHLRAYEYFIDHALPPPARDAATIPSTSVWGFSYLFELDVVYDIAAQLTWPLRWWTDDNLAAARIFQFSLWMLLLAMALARRRWAWVLSLTLISPQIWYVFSYLNADAFPLCIAFVAACLVADGESGVHAFVRDGDWRRSGFFVVAICLGLILVSKRNYLPVVPTFFLWLSVMHLRWRFYQVAATVTALLCFGAAAFAGELPALRGVNVVLTVIGAVLGIVVVGLELAKSRRQYAQRPALLRLIGLAVLCFAIALPRLAWDVHVNGLPTQKGELVRSIAEERAGPSFKPSAVAAGTGSPSVGMAGRGVTLSHVLFEPNNWLKSSMASFFGVYGYMSIAAPSWLYVVLIVNALLLLCLVLIALWRSDRPRFWAFSSVVFGGGVLVVASSLLLSWFDALQPQGRYLFPVLPMLGLIVGHACNRLPEPAYRLVVAAGLLLSVGSFLFVALPPFIDAR